jgi:hypothetical protein
MKAVIILAAIIATAATLGACRREEHTPMKLGADVVVLEQVAR